MKFEYSIVYSNRKTLAISVERDRSVVVRAPRDTSAEAIARVVENKKLWLWQKMGHTQKTQALRRSRELVSGTSLLYLGQELRLDFVPEAFKGVRLEEAIRLSRDSQPQAREVLRAWYREEARRHILPKAKYFAAHLGAHPNRILISEMRFRWGSCSPSGNLNFNWRLVKAPVPVLEYVVVHELAHLLELNHTPEFWNILRVQCPHYDHSKTWLKEHGHLLEEQV
jgi:predicted metal-dependent hydrolase